MELSVADPRGSGFRGANRMIPFVRNLLRQATIYAFHFLGFNRLFFILNRKRKRILTYHNIIPDRLFTGCLCEGVSHKESVFRWQLAWLKSRFRIGTNLTDPREITVTFDDGYLNQSAIAHPILVDQDIQAYFFCTLGLVRGSGSLLIDELLFWLSRVEPGTYSIHLPREASAIELVIRDDADRRACWIRLYPKLTGDYLSIAPGLYSEFDRCYPFEALRRKENPYNYALRFTSIPMSELEEMKRHGHQIATHGKTHAPLASLSAEELAREIDDCRAEVGKLYNSDVFSYPYGGLREVSPREIACVESRGFKFAVSNINRPLPDRRTYGKYFLPRMALPNSVNVAEIAFILSGAEYFLKFRRLLPDFSDKELP